MKIVPLLQTILDTLGIDASTILAQIDGEKNGLLKLHPTHASQLAQMLAPPGGGVSYFNVQIVDDDVIGFEFMTHFANYDQHLDFRTWCCHDGRIQHYVEAEQYEDRSILFTPAMVEAIVATDGPDYDRMPHMNGKPMSSVALLPRIIGDLTIATIQEASRYDIDRGEDQNPLIITYVRFLSDVEPVDVSPVPLLLAA